MTRIHKAVMTLVAGLMTAGLGLFPVAAQSAEPSSGWSPGQPVVVTVVNEHGATLLVLHAGRIPLTSDARARLFLPELGVRGIAYAVSVPAPTSELGQVGKLGETTGGVKTVIVPTAASNSVGGKSGSFLSISASGLQVSTGYDQSGDIVWNDPCVWGGSLPTGPAHMAQSGETTLAQGTGLMTEGGIGTKNVSTSVGADGLGVTKPGN